MYKAAYGVVGVYVCVCVCFVACFQIKMALITKTRHVLQSPHQMLTSNLVLKEKRNGFELTTNARFIAHSRN